MHSSIHKIIDKILDGLFPVRCLFCDDIVADDGYRDKEGDKSGSCKENDQPAEISRCRFVCPDCMKTLRYIKEPFCMK